LADTEARARDAAAMLENPLFNEAIDLLRNETMQAWVGTKADAVADRERLWVMVKMADRLRGYFQGVVDEGRFAASRVTKAPLP
jgi:hypothetical protein